MMQTILSKLSLMLILCIILMVSADAFLPSSAPSRQHSDTNSFSRHQRSFIQKSLQTLRAGASTDDINKGELVSALARLDREWKIQQAEPRGPKSRWTRILLDKDKEDTTSSDYSSYPPIPDTTDQNVCYLLEPPSSRPSCIIVFLGGAGLGSFPHISYNEFLVRLSDNLNAAVLAAPYSIGLDHFELAKTAGERLRKGLIECQEDASRLYSPDLPTYCLAHSLGCKLAAIYMSATSQSFDGIGFISFNNFSFAHTIGMAREFTNQIRQSSGSSPNESPLLNQIFQVAEQALNILGLDFTPSPQDMIRLMELKFADKAFKTRLFRFDDDLLDTSQELIDTVGPDISVAELPGNHLTPVFLKFGLDSLDMPSEARNLATEALRGYQSASFGNEEELDILVMEVCNFVLGKEPTQRSRRSGEETPQIAAAEEEVPLLTGGDDQSSS